MMAKICGASEIEQALHELAQMCRRSVSEVMAHWQIIRKYSRRLEKQDFIDFYTSNLEQYWSP